MKKTIVVADDDAAIRAALRKVLEDCDYAVRTASNGVEALAVLKEGPADLLLLDLDMPSRDGWDVLEDIESECAPIPVIILTGRFNQLASYDIPGVAALIAKPVDVQLLLDDIQRFIGQPVSDKPPLIHPPGTSTVQPCPDARAVSSPPPMEDGGQL